MTIWKCCKNGEKKTPKTFQNYVKSVENFVKIIRNVAKVTKNWLKLSEIL